MVLSSNEESFINVIHALPPVEERLVIDWALELADLAGGRAIDWSYSWSDEDLADATVGVVDRLGEQERETL